jgi:hypothetical protein
MTKAILAGASAMLNRSVALPVSCVVIFCSIIGCDRSAPPQSSPKNADRIHSRDGDGARSGESVEYALSVETANTFHRHLAKCDTMPNICFSYCGELTRTVPAKIQINNIDATTYYRWNVQTKSDGVNLILFVIEITTIRPKQFAAKLTVGDGTVYILFPSDKRLNSVSIDDNVPNPLKAPNLANITPHKIIDMICQIDK